jgi:hypothetical protein
MIMKNIGWYSSCAAIVLATLIACDDENPSKESELWPKSGYVFTNDRDAATVYVEASGLAVTSLFLPQYPINDVTKKWTLSAPGAGEGIYILNDKNQYWTIDSAFHPGLNVEQYFVSTVKVDDTENLGKINRFRYHASGDGSTFYLESVKFPKYFVTALGHAESGRGLLLRKQDNGDWKFWIAND